MNDQNRRCHLLGGWFAVLIQIGLALLCVLTLVYKRFREQPKRDWIVWSFDVMKQGFGASFGHFANILMSSKIANTLTSGDECQWYCLNFIVDSTFGTFFNISILMFFEFIVLRWWSLGKTSTCMQFGEYGNPPSVKAFFSQLGIWLFIIAVGKLIILPVLMYLSAPLNEFMEFLFSGLVDYPNSELIIVMVIVPLFLNTIQFWAQDTYLKQRDFSPLRQTDIGDDSLNIQNELGISLVSSSIAPSSSSSRYGTKRIQNIYKNNDNKQKDNIQKFNFSNITRGWLQQRSPTSKSSHDFDTSDWMM